MLEVRWSWTGPSASQNDGFQYKVSSERTSLNQIKLYTII